MSACDFVNNAIAFTINARYADSGVVISQKINGKIKVGIIPVMNNTFTISNRCVIKYTKVDIIF